MQQAAAEMKVMLPSAGESGKHNRDDGAANGAASIVTHHEESTALDRENLILDPRQGILAVIQCLFESAIRTAYPDYQGKRQGHSIAEVARCANPHFGDYQCNNSMSIFKDLKARKSPSASRSPQECAKAVIASLPSRASDIIESVSVAGGGFINVRVKADYLKARIRDVIANGIQVTLPHKKKVLVDFSSPNIAKEMHVGHLRSSIIGECICRMLEFLGHDVMRVNHVGDWGTQFGMLIHYLREEYPDFMQNPPDISDLTTFYKHAKRRFDDSEDFRLQARKGVVTLQAGDTQSRAIWKLLCDISRAEFQKVYDRLEVRLEEYGESFYNSMIPSTVEELDQKGLLVRDEGALLMWCGERHHSPLMVQKSDGGFGYDSTDLAAVRYRLKELQRRWVIYVTDAGQGPHFQLIFDAARKARWLDAGQQLDHVGFGVVQGEDSKRLKTRSGDTVRLVDLLDEAVERMTASLLERIQEGKCLLNEVEAREAATALGYGAVKYSDLKQNPGMDYQFSYDRMLNTRGDTAVYLLFTCARFHSILRKAAEEKGIDVARHIVTSEVVLEHSTERALALEISQFAEALTAAVTDLMPNRLCSYVYGLACKGTDFLESCHVLTKPDRLLLVQATCQVMERSLSLLGIRPLVKL